MNFVRQGFQKLSSDRHTPLSDIRLLHLKECISDTERRMSTNRL